MYTKFLRDADPGDTGGGLGSLVDSLTNPPELPPAPPPVPDAAEETAKAAQEALKAEALNEDGSVKPGFIKAADGTISKDADYKPEDTIDEVEGLDADGNLLPGYKKDEAGTIIVDPDYKPEELTAEQQSAAFFERVAAITGDELEIEYPEGIDPLSPEGIAHYTNVVREDAAIAFEQYLAQKDPRAWSYMLHRNAGGTDEEFLSGHKGFVLPEQADFDASADMQAAVYRYDLKARGLDDDVVETLVKKAITDNKLKDVANAAYKLIDEGQKKELSAIIQKTAEKDAADDKAIGTFLGKVDKAIASELKFVVSDTDKPVFRQFVIDNLRYDNNTGTFSVVQQIPEDQLNVMLEAMYFQHKKGNLKSLVEKQAKTIAAQNLRLKLKPANGGPGSGQGTDKDENNFIPLSEIQVKQ